MTDTTAFNFGKFIPGFDFLHQFAAARPGAGSQTPGFGGWVAPTVSVEELERRIHELKTVQFWLEQNAAAIKATIQALEVQKMTLATLQGMNLSMAEVVKTLTLPTGDAAPPQPSATPEPPATPAEPAAGATPPAAGLADPVAWWNALTQQFQQIAAHTLRETASAAPPAQVTAHSETASAASPKTTKPSATGKKTARKKPAASPARKSAAAAPGRTAAKTPPATWPLPPPFKPGR